MEATDCIVRLNSGRRLGYAEYGDPKGTPLFFFHGWPSSRFQGETLHKAAMKLGLRVIAPDRPGMGLSDFQDKRTLLGWTNDVAELANILDFKRIAVLGNSGGGPYVAACCFALPKSITHAGICVGLAQTDSTGVFEGMGPINRLSWELFIKYPKAIGISACVLFVRAHFAPILVHFLQKDSATQSLRNSIIKNRKEAFRQGMKGPAQELLLYSHNWGFNVHKISVPIKLWYGDSDKNVSLRMGQWYKEHLPKSTLKIYKGEDHFLLRRHTEEILRELIPGRIA